VDEASIITYVRETYPDADILTAGSGTFFSCDPEKHWPNFATLVTSDEYDSASNLDRPDVYRLNIGVSKATFDSVVKPLLDEAHERVARSRRKKKFAATTESR
jgi:hypothetical protein